jgi:hypothetical protein
MPLTSNQSSFFIPFLHVAPICQYEIYFNPTIPLSSQPSPCSSLSIPLSLEQHCHPSSSHLPTAASAAGWISTGVRPQDGSLPRPHGISPLACGLKARRGDQVATVAKRLGRCHHEQGMVRAPGSEMSTDEPEQWRLACGVDEGFCRGLLQVRVKGEMRVSHPSGGRMRAGLEAFFCRWTLKIKMRRGMRHLLELPL